MLLKETLQKVVQSQRQQLESLDVGVERELLKVIDLHSPFVVILSGIRRCGKSTLMRQLMRNVKKFYYLNFEDQRLLEFDVGDFEKLDEVFHEEFGMFTTYFFDEVQNVNGWERFVRKLQDNGKKVFITGSNASLLSKELGTRLTGRHIRYELFPFSFNEMLRFMSQKPTLSSFESYFNNGGFPDFLKYKKHEILQELLNDIITRDVIARYSLRDQKAVKEIALYLLTNAGKDFSYNKLAKYFDLGSVNTVKTYISYFEDSYLIFTIPKFDFSYKKQLINPKKVYSIDVGLSAVNSVSFSEDKGHIFENLVFLHLRRMFTEIFYFRERKECDFIVRDKGTFYAIQVCYELNEENKERELSGIKEAMQTLKIKSGIIITFNQEDQIGKIAVKPAWKWMIGKPSKVRYV